MPDKDEYRINGWHLKKEVTIGQIVALFTFASMFITWAMSIENRMVELQGTDKRIEEKFTLQTMSISDRFDRNQAAVQSAMNRITLQLDRIEDKLDGKADK